MSSFPAIESFAAAVAADPRVWRNYSTAIGEALEVGRGLLAGMEACRRKVIDVSGDGISNEGSAPRDIHPALAAENITVNALAIETDETDLTGYFYENLIVGEGAFVETATGFEDYPAAIRRKLQRETARATARTDPEAQTVPAGLR